MSHEGRTYVVTGSASGIGLATRHRIERGGGRVIGVDLRDAEVIADIADDDGRASLAASVGDLAGAVDGVVASAGVLLPDARTVRVNYFGVLATLENLRPLLQRSAAPAAVVVASMGAAMQSDREIVDACLAGDEPAACALADRSGDTAMIYKSTKRAIARWVRRRAVEPEWAQAGIPLNAVGPGVIRTPMMDAALDNPTSRARLEEEYPMPLGGLGAKPEEPAALLAWLVGAENRIITGQLVMVDGGYDATVHGDDTLPSL